MLSCFTSVGWVVCGICGSEYIKSFGRVGMYMLLALCVWACIRFYFECDGLERRCGLGLVVCYLGSKFNTD